MLLKLPHAVSHIFTFNEIAFRLRMCEILFGLLANCPWKWSRGCVRNFCSCEPKKGDKRTVSLNSLLDVEQHIVYDPVFFFEVMSRVVRFDTRGMAIV